MLTDWLIVRRLAAELDRALRGVRVRAAGRIAGGRFALRTRAECVVVDAFGETPLVTLEGPLSVEREAGWMRTMADALEGLRIERVRARHGDRLIAFDCSTRSRFGVESGYRFVVELVPRFGNVLLLKDDTIVSAAKEFTRAENRRRATIVGEPYEPPPLPAPEPGEGDLAAAFATLADGGDDAACERASRALRAAVPLLPKLVASSLVIETSRLSVVARVERCVERARAIVAASDGAANERGELYAYRAAGRLVQCHVVPLAQFSALERTR